MSRHIYPQSHWRAHLGNVTFYRRNGVTKLAWLKTNRSKLNETDVATQLNNAYELGRKEMREDIEAAMRSVKT